jgi:SET domain-containing protein
VIQPYLYIASSEGRGRGVYTRQDLPLGTVVESSPVLVMSGEERRVLDLTLLHDYIFEWGVERERCCMALGYLSLYNHAAPSNCEYFMDYDEDVIWVKTVRAIRAGEELSINYNGHFANADPVWFQII